MKIRRSSGDILYIAFNTTLLSIFTLSVFYPLIYILSLSFSAPLAIAAGKVWLFPVDISMEGYKKIFEYSNIWVGYGNSLFYAFFGTLINVIMTILAAYPLSRKDLKGRSLIMLLFSFTMFFSGGLVPTYLLISKLGLINTRWAMIIPGALAIWNVIITRTYYQATIPDDLLEASKIDGCSDFKFILKIVIPLSGAITAVNGLFYAVGHWNSYFEAFIFLNNPKLQPLQLVLRAILIMNTIDPKAIQSDVSSEQNKLFLRELLKYTTIVVGSLPMLCIYPFVQKYFVKGVMIGSIKG